MPTIPLLLLFSQTVFFGGGTAFREVVAFARIKEPVRGGLSILPKVWEPPRSGLEPGKKLTYDPAVENSHFYSSLKK